MGKRTRGACPQTVGAGAQVRRAVPTGDEDNRATGKTERIAASQDRIPQAGEIAMISGNRWRYSPALLLLPVERERLDDAAGGGVDDVHLRVETAEGFGGFLRHAARDEH